MIAFSIESEVSAVQEALKKTSASIPSITKKVLSATAKGFIKEYKLQVRSSGLKRRTGGLLGAYQYKTRTDSVTIYPAKGQVHKVLTLSEGKTITPRGKKFLKIKNEDGTSAFLKTVTIRGRGFVGRAENYFNSSQMGIDMQSVVDKEIQKMWG